QVREIAEQRHGSSRYVERKAPPRLRDRPEHAREQEPVAEQGDRITPAYRALGKEQVAGERHRRAEGEEHPEPVEGHAAPQVDDEGQPAERQRERDPQPAADVLLEHEVGEERDQQWAEVLDQQRYADLQAMDGEEVEELHERDAEDAERGDEGELAPADPQALR